MRGVRVDLATKYFRLKALGKLGTSIVGTLLPEESLVKISNVLAQLRAPAGSGKLLESSLEL